MSLSTLPYNLKALEAFLMTPVSRQMIEHLARKTSEVIPCDDDDAVVADPADLYRNASLPSLQEFIYALVVRSHVHTPTLMTSLVYLARLKAALPTRSRGMRCSLHRIFLASLIVAAKNHNDSSPKNKHWARYTAVKGYDDFAFSVGEINLMERQMLRLLNWDLRVTQDDLLEHFEPFLAPIRAKLKSRAECKALAAKMARPWAGSRSTAQTQGSARHSRNYDSFRIISRPTSRATSRPPSRQSARPISMYAAHDDPAAANTLLEPIVKPGSRASSRTASTQNSSSYSLASSASSCTVYEAGEVGMAAAAPGAAACPGARDCAGAVAVEVPAARSNPRPLSLNASVLTSRKHSHKPASLISRLFGGQRRSNRVSYHE
ncbi:hypothetical protein KEM52_003589 [Ascosphaera acerosa]|nr:hypothetical protein KEM52_003589 [Ascosphaera acerosa]